jgi:hypothetical protein
MAGIILLGAAHREFGIHRLRKWHAIRASTEAWRTYLAKMTTATVSIAIAVRRKLWPQRAINPSMFELL